MIEQKEIENNILNKGKKYPISISATSFTRASHCSAYVFLKDLILYRNYKKSDEVYYSSSSESTSLGKSAHRIFELIINTISLQTGKKQYKKVKPLLSDAIKTLDLNCFSADAFNFTPKFINCFERLEELLNPLGKSKESKLLECFKPTGEYNTEYTIQYPINIADKVFMVRTTMDLLLKTSASEYLIIDYKTGFNGVTDSIQAQMNFYYASLSYYLNIKKGIDYASIRMFIFDVRNGFCHELFSDGISLYNKLSSLRLYKQEDIKFTPDLNQCKYCDLKINCEAYTDKVYKSIDPLVKDLKEEKAELSMLQKDMVIGNLHTKYLPILYTVPTFLETLKKALISFAKAGGSIPGYYLELRKNKSIWRESEEVILKELKKMGVGKSVAIKKVLQSPAAIAKLIGFQNIENLVSPVHYNKLVKNEEKYNKGAVRDLLG